MKKLAIVLIITFFPLMKVSFVHAQTSVAGSITFLPYCRSDVGNIGILNYDHKLNQKWKMNIGLRYLHSTDGTMPDAKGYLLSRRFRPADMMQRLGLGAGVQYYFPKWSQYIDLYAFYDLTFFRSNTHANRFEPSGDSMLMHDRMIPLYERKWYNQENVISLESNLGLGIDADITGNFYFTARVGLGVNILSNLSPLYFEQSSAAQWSWHIGGGVGFRILR